MRISPRKASISFLKRYELCAMSKIDMECEKQHLIMIPFIALCDDLSTQQYIVLIQNKDRERMTSQLSAYCNKYDLHGNKTPK